MTQAPKPNSKSKPKQEPAAVLPPSPDAVSTATPRKLKSDEAANAAPIVC